MKSQPPSPSKGLLKLRKELDALQPPTLNEQIIEKLDDYHDGGMFHNYTPLEKQRHATQILALLKAAMPEKTKLNPIVMIEDHKLFFKGKVEGFNEAVNLMHERLGIK